LQKLDLIVDDPEAPLLDQKERGQIDQRHQDQNAEM
jgi:hypothetical protein